MNDRRTPPRKRRRIKFSYVLIALLVAGVAAFAIFRISTKFKLRAGIDAIRAAGYPVTGAELDQWYNIPPDAENAAYTMEEAFSFLNKWENDKSKPLPLIGRAEFPPRTEPLPEEMKILAAQYIADNNEALDLFHEAAEIENCRYPVDLSAGFATKLPRLAEIRKGARLLALDAVLHAENGDADSATRSAISGFGIARTLARLPNTVSQLVRADLLAEAAVKSFLSAKLTSGDALYWKDDGSALTTEADLEAFIDDVSASDNDALISEIDKFIKSHKAGKIFVDVNT